MELIDGPTLRDEFAKRGRLPREEALTIFFAIADALSYAHGRGVVHRDLKPANIPESLPAASRRSPTSA